MNAMTDKCVVCGAEIPTRKYWEVGAVNIRWFGGDGAFDTKTSLPGSTVSHRRWPRVCKACMARVVDVLEGRS